MPLHRLFGGSPWLTDDDVHQLRQHAFGRLRKVSRALSAWDPYDRAQADSAVPRAERPTLGRGSLLDLRAMLLERIVELDRRLSVGSPVGRVS